MTPGNPDRQDQRRHEATVPPELAGRRLDQALAELFSEYSRSRLQQWIRAGRVTLDGRLCKPRDPVSGGERVRLTAVLEVQDQCRPQPIPLDICYQDEQILVVNKPSGLVVHPAAGNPDGTLQNALLHHDAGLARLPRGGLIHRLDKDTSGLLVVARTPGAHRSLVEQLQARTITREYRALVSGVMVAGGSVDAPIGRHPVNRLRMAVVPNGKPAVTHYRVLERFPAHTWLKVNLETGRTHQIRVHMAHLRYPLVGDALYAGRLRLPPGAGDALKLQLRDFHRQALHACRLGLTHPGTGQWMEWTAPLPQDLENLLQALRDDAGR